MGARIVMVVACLLMCGVLVGCGADQFLGRDPPYPALDPKQIRRDTDPETGLTWVALDDLPATARATITLGKAGGTPPGSVGAEVDIAAVDLPEQPDRYYRTVGVPRPGESGPSPWYLVFGSDGEVFWTSNDFASLRRVQQ
jgi:ribonuclease T1